MIQISSCSKTIVKRLGSGHKRFTVRNWVCLRRIGEQKTFDELVISIPEKGFKKTENSKNEFINK